MRGKRGGRSAEKVVNTCVISVTKGDGGRGKARTFSKGKEGTVKEEHDVGCRKDVNSAPVTSTNGSLRPIYIDYAIPV